MAVAAAAVSAAPAAPARREPVRPRIGGIDLARALAILGMLAVHVGPTDEVGISGTLYAVPHGRAALLFGLVAGVGVALMAGSARMSASRLRVTLLWRAAVLLPLGLWLQTLDDHNVFVILADYAVLFVVAVGLVHLADRWLLVLAAAAATAGSGAYAWGLIHAPDAFVRRAAAWGDPVGELLHRLVLSGPYPLITWLAPFAVGLWLGRRDLRRRELAWALVLGGGGVAVSAVAVARVLGAWLGVPSEPGGWGLLLSAEPHSQMPLWVIGSTAAACAALGASLLVAERLGGLVWPLVATGQLAFTVYVGHLLLLDRFPDTLTSDDVAGATMIVLGFVLGAAVLATAWRAVLPRGPLEVLLRPPWPRGRTHGSRTAAVDR